MMMAQASIMTVIKGNPTARPLDVLSTTNRVIKEDISRLGSNHYMTMMVVKLEDDAMVVAGHHQDVLVYRSSQSSVTAIPTKGTWLGITDQIESFMEVRKIDVADNDVALFFTDGVTESTNASGRCTARSGCSRSSPRMPTSLWRKPSNGSSTTCGPSPSDQEDDMTIILLKKIPWVDGKKQMKSGGDGS